MFVLLYNSGKYDVKDIRYKHKGRLIARNSNKKCLLDVATNLNSDVPKIILKDISIVSIKSMNIPIKRLKTNNKRRKNIRPNSHCPKNNRNNKGNKANTEKNVINSRDKSYDEVAKFEKCLNNNLNDCNKLNKCDATENISDDKQKNTEVIDIMFNNNEGNNTVTTNIINENAFNNDSNSNKYDNAKFMKHLNNDINDSNILNSNDIRENSSNNYKNKEESDITLTHTLAHSSNNVVNNSNNEANTVANNIAEEKILNDKNYSISNITNGDNIVNPGHLKNNCNECSVLNTDIEKNSDIDNEHNSNKKNDTFNDIIDISDFCNRRSYFSHSTCICDTLSCSDKNANTCSKNNINDCSSCDICALNRTYSINKTPGILDQTIDPIKNSIVYNEKNNANRNEHINENKSEKNFENSFTTMDDENKNGENTYIVTEFSDDNDCAQESNKNDNTISNITKNNKDIKDLSNTTLAYNNDNMHENLINICDKNNSDITNYTDVIPNDTYTINDIGANNEVSCGDISVSNIYTNFENNFNDIMNVTNSDVANDNAGIESDKQNKSYTNNSNMDITDFNCNNINNEYESEYEKNNDSDYEPSLNSNTSDNDEIESNKQNKSDANNIDKDNKNKTIDSINISAESIRGCNDENMYVSVSKPKGAQKQNFCYFCKKFQSKIARHLEKVHCNEGEVQKFSVLPKGTLERKKIIETLRRNGNFLFNTNPLLNNGELIVCRRPQKKLGRTATDFTCCVKCKGFFTKNNIRHHFAQCTGKKAFRAVQVLGRKITGRIHNSASHTLKNVIYPVLRDDIVTRSIKYDQLLITYGNKLAVKYKHLHQHDMIRSRLRLLGRFWLAMKKFNEGLEQFSSIYDPQYYDDCIKSVHEIAQLDEETNTYKAPATASTIGTLLKQVGNLFITECIKIHDYKRKENAENFLKILQEDYTTTVNKVVEETQSQKRRQKKIVLPSIDDIKKLYNYLHQKRKAAYDQLKQGFLYEAWLSLAQSTLILLQLFNRRRAGEIERVLIEDFQSYTSINKDTHKELYQSLSSTAQKKVKKYVIFAIRGKLMRTVPVILHSQLLECLQMILKHRDNAKVPSKNPFLFGIPNDNKKRFKYLRACVLLRTFSKDCGATLPCSLRGTQLRKHIATCCITLNLSEDQVTDLANFMGHDKSIHKSHYRQPIPELEIIRMTQFLEAAQGGTEKENEEEDDENFNNSDHSDDNDNMDKNNGIYDNESEDEERNMEDISFQVQQRKNVGTKIPKKAVSVKNNKKKRSSGIYDNESEDEERNMEDISFQVEQRKNVGTKFTKKAISVKNNKKKRRSTSPYGRTRRTRWSLDECTVGYEEFKIFISNQELPSTSDILRIRSKNPILQDRTVAQIRSWLHNYISGKTKKRTL